MKNNIRFLVLVLAACGAAAQAQTTQTFKFGATYYEPHSRSNGVNGIGLPAGADANVGAAGTLLLTYEIAVLPKVGIEFVLGVPPTIKTRGTGSVAFLGTVLSVHNVAPTVFANYHFGEVGDRWRPYLGIGANYTHFGSPSSSYFASVKLKDSYGLAAVAGVDYAINKQWGLFASFARADVKTHLVATGSVVVQSDIDLRPVIYSLGAAFKF